MSFMVIVLIISISCDQNCFSLGFALHNIHCIIGLFVCLFFFFIYLKNWFSVFQIKIKKKNQKKKGRFFVLYIFKMCNWGWPTKFTFHDCVSYLALMSFIFLHFASLWYVVLIFCELFMVVKHMFLILKSHSFDCKD